MATKSVTTNIPKALLLDLPDLMRQTEDTAVPFANIHREQFVDWITALSDLLMFAPEDEIANDTLHDAAWLLYELSRTVKAFDACLHRKVSPTGDTTAMEDAA